MLIKPDTELRILLDRRDLSVIDPSDKHLMHLEGCTKDVFDQTYFVGEDLLINYKFMLEIYPKLHTHTHKLLAYKLGSNLEIATTKDTEHSN